MVCFCAEIRNSYFGIIVELALLVCLDVLLSSVRAPVFDV